MSPRLKVSEYTVQRIQELEKGSCGFLLGISDGNLTYVLGLVKHFNDPEENNSDLPDLSNYDIALNCPGNINYCGLFNVFAVTKQSDDIINDLCKKIDGTPVVIDFELYTKTLNAYFYEEGGLKNTEHEIINKNDLSKSFLHLRLTATIPLSCDLNSEGLVEAFNLINEKIIDGNSAFHILKSEIFILGDKPSDVSGTSFDITLDKVFSLQTIGSNKSPGGINILNVGLYLKGTNNDKSPQLAPLIKYVKKTYKHIGIELSIDSMSIVHTQLKLSQLYPILVESACRNLALIKENLLSQLVSGPLKNVSLPVTYHFLPPSCGHFVSIVYPAKQSTELSINTRKAFHSLLSLPMDGPIFRPGNAFQFSHDKTFSRNLIFNPHVGICGSGVPDGESSFVKGTYIYFHYMQDNFDDSGWGCAYRSLQTIFSWFKFQGYTTMLIPTHTEIQKCLVNIGDKPTSFIGSKQWIGSTEVSFVLDTMLGVTCRILSVNSGEEMSALGGELSYHFKKQGTPIMIGGGVLAHTILGVDYNKRTGAIKFLILDPHYTGVDDLKIVQSKGWCGWKGIDFWKKNAFYNMCLPLKPNSI